MVARHIFLKLDFLPLPIGPPVDLDSELGLEAIAKNGDDRHAGNLTEFTPETAGRAQERPLALRQPRIVLQDVDIVPVLVNNAGVSGEHPFLEMELAEWDRILAVNLTGAFLCSQAVARTMVRAGRGGKIINITSVNAEIVVPGLCHYCASKGGLRMLTKDLAVELAPHLINVNAVGPGIIHTSLTAPSLDNPDKLRSLLGHVPWGRVG